MGAYRVQTGGSHWLIGHQLAGHTAGRKENFQCFKCREWEGFIFSVNNFTILSLKSRYVSINLD